MTRALTLADFAQVEAEGRARFYPQMVAKGEITADEAGHDWRCWLAIADFFAGPAEYRLPASWLTWADLSEAAARGLKRREQALAECKPEMVGPLTDRRDAIAAMAWRLGRRAQFFRELNAQLEAQAKARRTARERAAA
jgi:hypothetical protein